MSPEMQADLLALERRLQVAKDEVAAMTSRLVTIRQLADAELPAPSQPPTIAEIHMAGVIGMIKDVASD